MKRISITISVIIFLILVVQLLSFAIGFQPSLSNSSNLIQNDPCGNPAFIVETESSSPADLTILESRCDGEFRWKAQIELKNISGKVIRGYDVADVSNYENKKDVWFSQGRNGEELKPGESITLYCNAGFVNGESYGKPVGQLQKVVFRVEKIEFSDGTIWKSEKARH